MPTQPNKGNHHPVRNQQHETMKKILYTLLFPSLIFTLIMCEKGNDNPNRNIVLAETLPGGCNDETFMLNKDATEEEDTVTFTIINDTLDVYVGINYICCAPFEAGSNIANDTITIIITDVCDHTSMSCYCHCMCYYTWNFRFVGYDATHYYIKIILNDPREEDSILLEEGILDLS